MINHSYASTVSPADECLLDALVLHDDATDDVHVDAFAKDFPELYSIPAEFTTLRVYVDQSELASDPATRPAVVSTALPPTRNLMSKENRKRHRRRNRKRTDEQKEAENAKRRVQQVRFRARRMDCLNQEQRVRAHVRQWIGAYASAIGVAFVDATILPYLPAELRAIMARSDAALETYRGFAGQTTLREALNAMPAWW